MIFLLKAIKCVYAISAVSHHDRLFVVVARFWIHAISMDSQSVCQFLQMPIYALSSLHCLRLGFLHDRHNIF